MEVGLQSYVLAMGELGCEDARAEALPPGRAEDCDLFALAKTAPMAAQVSSIS